MPVVPACILEPLRKEFLALLPEHRDDHPLGCHNPRLPDALVFDRLILVLVSGMGYGRVADQACSATTIRRCRDHWITLGRVRHRAWRLWPPTTAWSAWSWNTWLPTAAGPRRPPEANARARARLTVPNRASNARS